MKQNSHSRELKFIDIFFYKPNIINALNLFQPPNSFWQDEAFALFVQTVRQLYQKSEETNCASRVME